MVVKLENLWGKGRHLKLSVETSVLIVAMFCSKCSCVCPHTPCRLACWCFTLFFFSLRVTSFIIWKIMSVLWRESFKIRWKHSPYHCQPACHLCICSSLARTEGFSRTGYGRGWHRYVVLTLWARLSGTFLQTLPEWGTPLKGHSLSPCSCLPALSSPSESCGR